MKKLISIALIISLSSYLTGCYSMKGVTKEDLQSDSQREKLDLITKDNETYIFEEGAYFIESDTLIGSGLKISSEDTTSFDGEIPLKNFKEINIKKVNALLSISLGLYIIIGLAYLISKIPDQNPEK